MPQYATLNASKQLQCQMPSICLICALPAEARPLISYFGMRALNHPHLRLYKADFGYLLQCGVGKLNASANTATLLEAQPDINAVINIGISGSDHPLGETLIAHAIEDQASSKKWYPHLPPVNKLATVPSVQVVTVDKPANDYSADIAFDMEAAGIFNAASKVIDLAFVHSIKVVSDNSESGLQAISVKTVTDNISNAIPTVEKLMQALPFEVLPIIDMVETLVTSLTTRMHYTATERHMLNQLLHRHNALFGELPANTLLQNHNSAKALRRALLSMIDNARVTY